MAEISVIVPVYRAEKYLAQCIDSILGQTYRDFELILVDDGSPDACGKICDEYAQKDSRVSVIHKDNGGVVSARKAGVIAATGKYCASIDSDDWIDGDMLEHLLLKAHKYDAEMVLCGYMTNNDSGAITVNSSPSGLYKGAELESLKKTAMYTGHFYECGLMPSLCTRIIKTDLLKKYQLKVDDCVRIGDDAAVTYPALAEAKCVVIDNEFVPYHYRQSNDSMTHSYDSAYFDRAEKLFVCLENTFNEVNNADLQDSLVYYKLFIIKYGLGQLIWDNRTDSIAEKIKAVRTIIAQFNISKLMEAIDKSGFNAEDRRQFELLANSRPGEYIFRQYALHAKDKLFK